MARRPIAYEHDTAILAGCIIKARGHQYGEHILMLAHACVTFLQHLWPSIYCDETERALYMGNLP